MNQVITGSAEHHVVSGIKMLSVYIRQQLSTPPMLLLVLMTLLLFLSSRSSGIDFLSYGGAGGVLDHTGHQIYFPCHFRMASTLKFGPNVH